jgi:hypothetical protein
MDCFPENIIKVRKAITQYSGKHSIDKTIAEEFIQSQLTDIRKQAARDIVEHTIYITLEEVATIIEQLILKTYREQHLESAENVYIYSGLPEKSSYFISVLALDVIQKHHLKPPQFVKKLNHELLDIIGSNPLLIIDDVAYTGSQLSDMLGNLYYDRVILHRQAVPNISVVLVALNHFSKKALEFVPSKKRLHKYVEEYIASPFPLVFLPERLYTPLVVQIGLERYFNVNVFFSPYTGSGPYISMYLDHKIADEVSTYKTALLYGPTIPSNYDYMRFFREMDNMVCLIPPLRLLEKPVFDKLLADIHMNLPTTSSVAIIEKTIVNTLIQKLIHSDMGSLDMDITHSSFQTTFQTTFHPFIQNGKKHNPEIQNLPYALFISPGGCIREGTDNVISNECKGYIQDYIREHNLLRTTFSGILDNIPNEKIVEVFDQKHNIGFPDTWYKKGEFQMS